MKAMINAMTGIMCVTLPIFDREKPMKGTKAARVRFLHAKDLCLPAHSALLHL